MSGLEPSLVELFGLNAAAMQALRRRSLSSAYRRPPRVVTPSVSKLLPPVTADAPDRRVRRVAGKADTYYVRDDTRRGRRQRLKPDVFARKRDEVDAARKAAECEAILVAYSTEKRQRVRNHLQFRLQRLRRSQAAAAGRSRV